MNSSTLIKAITVLGALTIANICGILGIGYYNAQPYSDYSIDTLGAVFHQPTEDNVVEVSLVRPPRQTVHPGETARYEGFITNPNKNPIHCRSTYQVIIKDGQGQNKGGEEHAQVADWILIHMHPYDNLDNSRS